MVSIAFWRFLDPCMFVAAMIASEEADAAALEAVENLLESYFVQVDSTFDKLEAIGARAVVCLGLRASHSMPPAGSAGCCATSHDGGRDLTLSKACWTGEYIEDTEEYINIELDSSRNRLIRLEIVLTGATFSLALWNLVAGVHTPFDAAAEHNKETCALASQRRCCSHLPCRQT